MELLHDTQGGAPLHGREGAGVADGHNPGGRAVHQLLDEVRAARRHGGAGRDVLVADREGLIEDGVRSVGEPGQRAVRAPGKVDRGWPCGAEPGGTVADGGLVVGMEPCQERDAERAGDTQRRGPAHGQAADRVDECLERVDPQEQELVGEPGLVDEADGAVDPVDRPIGHGGPR